jgi:hypothetical protein
MEPANMIYVNAAGPKTLVVFAANREIAKANTFSTDSKSTKREKMATGKTTSENENYARSNVFGLDIPLFVLTSLGKAHN